MAQVTIETQVKLYHLALTEYETRVLRTILYRHVGGTGLARKASDCIDRALSKVGVEDIEDLFDGDITCKEGETK